LKEFLPNLLLILVQILLSQTSMIERRIAEKAHAHIVCTWALFLAVIVGRDVL